MSGLPAPAGLVAEPSYQALVVGPVVLFQLDTDFVGHRRARARVAGCEVRPVDVGQAKELDGLVVDRTRVGEEVPAVDDVDPVAAEDLLQVLELVDVVPAGAVAVEPVLEAVE